MDKRVDDGQVPKLLPPALETERGGIQVCTTALEAAENGDLKKERHDQYLRGCRRTW